MSLTWWLLSLVLFSLIEQYQLESNLGDFSFKSFKPKLDLKTFLPKIPKHVQLYIAAAFPEKDFQSYSKVFNRTLSGISSSFQISDSFQRNYNVTVEPLFFVLPSSGRFSASIYEVMCSSFDNKRVAAIFVVGENPAAFAVSLAATTSNVPVLWARGEAPFPLSTLQPQTDSLEVRLEPSELHLLEAVRGVLLATHWHTFTVMAAPSLATRCATILDQDPLNPKVVSISRNPHAIFRKLADVSRATRGVVLLLCDITDAILVMDVARKLNMIDGHFVWLWIDTTTKPATFVSPPTKLNATLHLDLKQSRRRGENNRFTSRTRRSLKSGLSLSSNRSNSGQFQNTQDLKRVARKAYQGFAIGVDDDDRGDPEEEDDFEEISPISKSWGKITEMFPFSKGSNREEDKGNSQPRDTNLPLGMLAIKPEPVRLDRHLVKGTVRLLLSSLHTVLRTNADLISALDSDTSCWMKPTLNNKNFSIQYTREIRRLVKETLSGQTQFQEGDRADRALLSNFQILNLVPEKFNINFNGDTAGVVSDAVLSWRQVGRVSGRTAHLDTIVWPGGDLVASALSARTRTVFRIVTALGPPFVMEGALDEDGQCLRGVICHRVFNSDKDNLTIVFNEMDTQERLEEEDAELGGDDRTEKPFRFPESQFVDHSKQKYKSSCCYGFAMDLLENMAQELQFEFHLYIVPDGLYGATTHSWETGTARPKWNGIVGDLVSGAAHMSFAALSVSKQRSQVIDFSTPYFFSGVSFLAAPSRRSEVPLLAFLLPFSPELWIAIFTSLNITAMAVACYEWLSPFGLNPWGRQRSRNFSIASALWVCWGLLCGHLVAFKAPKSWPNKFLINVWGGFSVIFVASYTANIAALIAGLFFHSPVSDYFDGSLLNQRVGTPRASASEYYTNRLNPHLSEHMRKYPVKDMEHGITLLKNGSLDILVADTAILDYYRMTDHGCQLQKIVESMTEDTYAIGMNKGFPLKESISAVISKYNTNGYIDILKEKWYGGLPCYKTVAPVDIDMAQPRPLGVAAVLGVFILLGCGMGVGLLILLIEHLFYRYYLPALRQKEKGTIWRSRNIMFFSQKLYRFINCVELVSPHHAARELVTTLRQGQITSLFQKSVRRKEHEQRRRRKSKAQFFEMIQEIRRVQQEERDDLKPSVEPQLDLSSPRSPLKTFLSSPRSLKQAFLNNNNKEETLHERRTAKSVSRLDIRRFSKDLFSLPRSPKSPKDKSLTSLDSEGRLSAKETSAAIGRRLSKDASTWLSSSPPDINSRRRSHLDITQTKSLNVEDAPKFFTLSNTNLRSPEVISEAATQRLASSGSIKSRPRMPSPPSSPVVGLRLPSTPKINISDTTLYETIATEKPKGTHMRSKSLDNKPSMKLVEISPNNEKQTVNYATIEHKTLKTIKNNTKPTEERISYSEMTQGHVQTLLKQTKNEERPPKSNVLKQTQARAYSAPEEPKRTPQKSSQKMMRDERGVYHQRSLDRDVRRCEKQATVIVIPDERFKSPKRCFETFPKDNRRCPVYPEHTSRCDVERRFLSDQRHMPPATMCETPRKRKSETPVLHHCHSQETPNKATQGILKTTPRRRARSRDSDDYLSDVPPSSYRQTNPEILLTIKRQGYMKPP